MKKTITVHTCDTCGDEKDVAVVTVSANSDNATLDLCPAHWEALKRSLNTWRVTEPASTTQSAPKKAPEKAPEAPKVATSIKETPRAPKNAKKAPAKRRKATAVSGARPASSVGDISDIRALRTWAVENNLIQAGQRGRIPEKVREAYLATKAG